MVRVGVGSKNPAKVTAVRLAFQTMGHEIEITGFDVDSGVSKQPFSDDETIQGAVQRARHVMDQFGKEHRLDYSVGLEGGVAQSGSGMFLCNWGAVVNPDNLMGIGGGHRIAVPPRIASMLREGRELGHVIDEVMGRHGIAKEEGTVGILTNNLITRQTMFRDVVLCAFSRFLHPELYS